MKKNSSSVGKHKGKVLGADPVYKDPSKSVEERVSDLMSRMTLEEKIGQTCQQPVFVDVVREVVENNIGSILCGVDDDVFEAQKAAVEKTRLGIPLIVGIDAIHGHSMEYNATMFPSQLGLSCAWDETLCERVARATAREMAYTGCHWTFSPVLCMARDPRWGRVNETFGEDGFLIGKFASAMIRGYQGKSLSDPESVAACAKHFAGYGETSGGREASESDHSERKMRAVFLPPFEEAAKAGCASFMTAYQVIDGVPCTGSRWLLDTILRKEWHSDAVVVTDWANVCRLKNEQFVASDDDEAAIIAVNAGNDMMMTPGDYIRHAIDMVKAGRIPVEVIDRAVARILKLKFRLGLFENPRFFDRVRASKVVGCEEHRKLALEAAAKSAVLLKNDGILPVRTDTLRKIAVIGPAADDDLQQLGDWSLGAGQNQGMMFKHSRKSTCTLLDGIIEEFGEKCEITFARGCSGVGGETSREMSHAVRVASESDLVIIQLGDNLRYVGEGCSTATLELQGGQKELFDAVAATGVPAVVVFTGSKPLILTKMDIEANAILCTFNSGMEGGRAAAQILSGKRCPEGRLTVSFPCHAGQLPVFYNQTAGAHHSSYPDLPGKGFFGLYPFGFGLSYSKFRYYGPSLEKTEFHAGESVSLRIKVRNIGEYETAETVQLYMRDRVSSVTWPRKNLIDFRKIRLVPGETAEVLFTVPYEKFSIVNSSCERVVEPGVFDLLVGSSSADRDLKTVSLTYVD